MNRIESLSICLFGQWGGKKQELVAEKSPPSPNQLGEVVVSGSVSYSGPATASSNRYESFRVALLLILRLVGHGEETQLRRQSRPRRPAFHHRRHAGPPRSRAPPVVPYSCHSVLLFPMLCACRGFPSPALYPSLSCSRFLARAPPPFASHCLMLPLAPSATSTRPCSSSWTFKTPSASRPPALEIPHGLL